MSSTRTEITHMLAFTIFIDDLMSFPDCRSCKFNPLLGSNYTESDGTAQITAERFCSQKIKHAKI